MVGLSFEDGSGIEEIEERKRGHSIIARESVFSSKGRTVKREKCVEGSDWRVGGLSGKIA